MLMFAAYGFIVTFCLVFLCGAVMNYSLFLCTALNCALTTSLVGVIKSVLQTAIGFFTFGGVKILPLNATGITMNLIGGILYTYAKYNESFKKLDKISKKNDDEEVNDADQFRV
ncbi:UDP-galactose/UDP-glucose transporter 7 [Nymphon striatum]|nr:UDP-galactose/UDP-glucose transporter 7 [Nymphon striatum]